MNKQNMLGATALLAITLSAVSTLAQPRRAKSSTGKSPPRTLRTTRSASALSAGW